MIVRIAAMVVLCASLAYAQTATPTVQPADEGAAATPEQIFQRLRERRKEGIEGARTEATQMTATAEAKLAEYEKSLATARNKANEEGSKVRREAAAHEQEVTTKARTAALASIEEAQQKMRSETEAARAELMPQAEALAATMAKKLLGREVV